MLSMAMRRCQHTLVSFVPYHGIIAVPVSAQGAQVIVCARRRPAALLFSMTRLAPLPALSARCEILHRVSNEAQAHYC